MATKISGPNKKPSNLIRLTIFWVIIALCVFFGIQYFSPQEKLKEVAISDVISRANAGEITKIQIQGDELKVTPKGQSDPTEKSVKQSGSSIQEQGLKSDAKVELTITPPSNANDIMINLAMTILPMILIFGLFMFFALTPICTFSNILA